MIVWLRILTDIAFLRNGWTKMRSPCIHLVSSTRFTLAIKCWFINGCVSPGYTLCQYLLLYLCYCYILNILPSFSDRTKSDIPFSLSTKADDTWPVPLSSHIRLSFNMYSFTRLRVFVSAILLFSSNQRLTSHYQSQ